MSYEDGKFPIAESIHGRRRSQMTRESHEVPAGATAADIANLLKEHDTIVFRTPLVLDETIDLSTVGSKVIIGRLTGDE